mgnify:CR=1 FL=1
MGLFMRLVPAVMVAWALASSPAIALAGDGRPRDCKNHYILEPPCLLDEGPAATVRIAKLFSTLDGTFQAIELEVVGGTQLPLPLVGRRMTVRDLHGRARSFVLDEPRYRNRPRLLVAGDAWDWMSHDALGPYSDLSMPGNFLPIDGGEIAIDGMDAMRFGPLPVDGRSALARDGAVVPAAFDLWGLWDHEATYVSEFYHAGLDHYFMTNRADEIALLRSGAIPGWQATGKAFYGTVRPVGQGYFPVCRYLLLRTAGYSHFFSASKAECDALAGQPGNVLESSNAFHVGLPVDGVCATRGLVPGGYSGLIGGPVYRLWNGKPDTNHRFVTDEAERDAMIARGWILEGEGIDGIAMCAWSTTDPPPLP